jgi:hypothetical protein
VSWGQKVLGLIRERIQREITGDLSRNRLIKGKQKQSKSVLSDGRVGRLKKDLCWRHQNLKLSLGSADMEKSVLENCYVSLTSRDWAMSHPSLLPQVLTW